MFSKAFLGLGSNVGSRKELISEALRLLGEHEHIEIEKVSTLIETDAVAAIKQPKFINGAVQLTTLLTAQELFVLTQDIKKKIGRIQKNTYDPRLIDLDLLFFNNEIILEDDLIVPHPLLHLRPFVLVPLNEIAPDFLHPILNETIASITRKVVGPI